MQRSILLVLFLATITNCFSQLNKGSFLVGGAISFQSSKYTASDNATTTFLAAPDAGYFFMDKLAGGLRTSFSYQSNDGDSRLDFFAGPFVRYYFLPVTRQINLLLDGSFMIGTEKYQNFDAETKTAYGFAAGPAFFVNPHIAVEATLGWRSLKYRDDAGRYNTFGLSVGFQLHLQPRKKGK
jgi:hypothetical protein